MNSRWSIIGNSLLRIIYQRIVQTLFFIGSTWNQSDLFIFLCRLMGSVQPDTSERRAFLILRPAAHVSDPTYILQPPLAIYQRGRRSRRYPSMSAQADLQPCLRALTHPDSQHASAPVYHGATSTYVQLSSAAHLLRATLILLFGLIYEL